MLGELWAIAIDAAAKRIGLANIRQQRNQNTTRSFKCTELNIYTVQSSVDHNEIYSKEFDSHAILSILDLVNWQRRALISFEWYINSHLDSVFEHIFLVVVWYLHN